jgi:CBS domain-containing protein/RNA polymerase-binding transcription factor DksA
MRQQTREVRDWMTSDPVTVREDGSALEAFDLMVDRGVRHLPVVEDGGSLIGILSIDDLRAALPVDVSLKRALGPIERDRMLGYRVADAMTWVPQTVQPDTALEEAAARLCEGRIGCLPVVDGEGRLLGILSETDVLRALVTMARGETPAVGTAAESQGLVAALERERRRIADRLQQWQDTERQLSADIREEPRDAGDRAGDERELASLEPLSERAFRRLRAIDAALERASQKRFGICDRCGEHIAVARLRAIPETTRCVRCARDLAGVAPGAAP